MRLTVDEVYDRLINDDKILTQKGRITFQLGDIGIIVRQRDVVGNIMQEWVEGWLKKNNVEFAPSENSQMPPDFYLNPQDKKSNLMEIKAFNYKAAPGFDIADFRMYEQEIAQKPWMLDVTYLIFGYDMSDDGIVTIKRVWKQKVWEITRSMISGKTTPWPLNLQIKKGIVSKMRPAKWYAKAGRFPTFARLEDFLSAVEETVYQNVDTRTDGPSWKHKLLKAYKEHFGVSLSIPRWSDIQDKYILPK